MMPLDSTTLSVIVEHFWAWGVIFTCLNFAILNLVKKQGQWIILLPFKPCLSFSQGTTEKGVNSLLSWMDCVTSVSIGQLLAETSKVNQSGQLVNTDSFDVAILGLMAQNHDSSYSTLSSIWEAEETRHAFPSTKTAFSKDQILPASNQIVVQVGFSVRTRPFSLSLSVSHTHT